MIAFLPYFLQYMEIVLLGIDQGSIFYHQRLEFVASLVVVL